MDGPVEWRLFGELMAAEGLGTAAARAQARKTVDTHRVTRLWNARVNAAREADPRSPLTYKVPTYISNAYLRWLRRRHDDAELQANAAVITSTSARLAVHAAEHPAPLLPSPPVSTSASA